MSWLDELRFDASGLLPVVAQDVDSGEVLMVAFANRDALERTIATGAAHYFSRSRASLWRKGETSGHVQDVEDVRVDCDGDAVLYRVRQTGPACHTLQPSCFHRSVTDHRLAPSERGLPMLTRVAEIVRERQRTRPAGSYTTYLFDQGVDKILKKVGEESTEVVIAAKNGSAAELRSEIADLFFHVLVLLQERGVALGEVWDELERRFGRTSRIPGRSSTDRSS